MTDAHATSPSNAASKPDLGRFGSFGRGVTPQQAKEIEALGYGAVWVGGSPPAELAWVEPILEATTTLQVATGIVNIWTAAAKPVAESFHRIDKAYPGRFLLGIGVGHREPTSEYRKPYDALVEYLDELDAAMRADQPSRGGGARARGSSSSRRNAARARIRT